MNTSINISMALTGKFNALKISTVRFEKRRYLVFLYKICPELKYIEKEKISFDCDR